MQEFIKLRYLLVVVLIIWLSYFIINNQSSQMDKRVKQQQELKTETEQLTWQIASLIKERNAKDKKLSQITKLISWVQHLDTTRSWMVAALESLSNTDESVSLPITNTWTKQSK